MRPPVPNTNLITYHGHAEPRKFPKDDISMHTAGGNPKFHSIHFCPFQTRHSSTSCISCAFYFSTCSEPAEMNRISGSNRLAGQNCRGKRVTAKLKLSLFTNHEYMRMRAALATTSSKKRQVCCCRAGREHFSITSSPCRKKQKFVLAQSKKSDDLFISVVDALWTF